MSLIISSVTLTLLMSLLPAGIMDGILSGSTLILMLMQFYGDKTIVEENGKK